MAKGIARYIITSGLAGCYMPDMNHGPMQFDTRKQLAWFIRNELQALDWPANMIETVGIRRLWRHIANYGSSVAHFRLEREGYELAFHGLTDQEYHDASAENEAR